MNRHLLSLLVAASAALAANVSHAGTALAGDITIEDPPFVPTLARDQVRMELHEFQAAGVNPWADEYNPLAGFASSRTRAQARAEYIDSRSEVAAFTGEDSGSVFLAAIKRPTDRMLAGEPKKVE